MSSEIAKHHQRFKLSLLSAAKLGISAGIRTFGRAQWQIDMNVWHKDYPNAYNKIIRLCQNGIFGPTIAADLGLSRGSNE